MKLSFVIMETDAIYEGDNLEIMSKFPSKSIDLIYADPPFFTNATYEVIWHDKAEIRSFEDRWEGGILHYINWIEPRLRECHRLLKDTGAFYLHCDWHASHYLKVELDKIFGRENFRNEISVKRIRKNVHEREEVKSLNTAFDSILFYAKSDKHFITPPMKEEYKPARWHAFDANGVRTGMDYDLFGYKPKRGNHWRWTKERADQAIKEGILRPNPSSGKPEYLIPASDHTLITSVWDDIPAYSFESGYPTEKSPELLERIINMSSKKGDIVLDPFCGCGTAIVASQKLKRNWIGIDISPTACNLMRKRMIHEFRISPQVIRGTVDVSYVKKLKPFEFQNWVVTNKFFGTVSKTKSGDFGIDGLTPQVTGGFPIQVKQSETIGRNVIDNFETAMRRMNKKKGYVVAFSFGRGAVEEVARVKNQEGIEIILRTVQDLLDGKIE